MPNSNSPELELFHRFRLKSPAPAGSGSTTLVLINDNKIEKRVRFEHGLKQNPPLDFLLCSKLHEQYGYIIKKYK